MLIYHIVLPEVWQKFQGKNSYRAASLDTEGFIHCSFAEQLDAVLGRYYSDAEEVVILSIDAGKLTSKLVSEPSTNKENYPHIYGEINLDAVVNARNRNLNADRTDVADI